MPNSTDMRYASFRAGIALITTILIWQFGVAILWLCRLNTIPAYSTIAILGILLPLFYLLRPTPQIPNSKSSNLNYISSNLNSTSSNLNSKFHLITSLLYLTAIALSLIYTLLIPDTSCDGNLYHIPTLTAMLKGWNPIYDILTYDSPYDLISYVRHYARGLEMTGLPITSLLHLLTNSAPLSTSTLLQAGKILNPLLPLTTLLIGYAILPSTPKTATQKNQKATKAAENTKSNISKSPKATKAAENTKSKISKSPKAVKAGASLCSPCRSLGERKSLPLYHPLIAASLFSFNPIIIAQSFTFYCDSLLYSELLLMGYALYLLLTRSNIPTKAPLYILFAATILAISTKFTHFFYCGIMWGIILIWLAIRHRHILPPLLTAASATIIALLTTCYSPYITNWLQVGNPLFPLLGCEGFDIMTPLTYEIYEGHNRLYNLLLSHLSIPEQPWVLLTDPIPYLLNPREGLFIDSRHLPYGVFYPAMVLISLTLMLLSPRRKTYLLITLLIIASPLLIEQSWWARYVPTLWAIIPLAYLSTQSTTPNPKSTPQKSNPESTPQNLDPESTSQNSAPDSKIKVQNSKYTKPLLTATLLLLTLTTWAIAITKIHTQQRLFDPTEYRQTLTNSLPTLNHLQ